MKVFTFVVDFANDKDAVMAGAVDGHAAVTVAADDAVEARLTAEQMVGALGIEPVALTQLDRSAL